MEVVLVIVILFAGVGLNWWADGLQARQLEVQAAERERLKYRAKDFAGVAKAPAAGPPVTALAKPAPTATALTSLAADSVLAQVVAERRPAWAKALEGLFLAVVLIAMVLMLGVASLARHGTYRSDAGAPEAVAELLEVNGFAAPKVKRQMLATHCYQSFAYRWSAMGAKGRACVNYYDGEIQVKVDKSWGPLPIPFEGPRPPPPR